MGVQVFQPLGAVIRDSFRVSAARGVRDPAEFTLIGE
jgi:hypothetical protein